MKIFYDEAGYEPAIQNFVREAKEVAKVLGMQTIKIPSNRNEVDVITVYNPNSHYISATVPVTTW
jgi:pantoate kinase